VFDFMERLEPRLPIGFIGNSMGGAVAMHLAAREPRIVACCDNGGPLDPGRARAMTVTMKMAAHLGDVSPEFAIEVWKSIVPADPTKPLKCPLLVVHGALDPLVPTAEAEAIFASGVAADRNMFEYSDGDHCIYNHADDKHALICDWMASRLSES
jgi:pimeloyl-ACP methyl ester carboxylesterase